MCVAVDVCVCNPFDVMGVQSARVYERREDSERHVNVGITVIILHFQHSFLFYEVLFQFLSVMVMTKEDESLCLICVLLQHSM